MDVRAGHKEGWVPKNWCFQTVVLEKILESPLDCKEIKPVNPKENQLWIFIGRTDAETEAPILWPPDVKSKLIEKDLMLGKTEGRRRSGQWGWDGWIASLTQCTRIGANSRRWWRTEEAGMLWSMGLQRIIHDLGLNNDSNTPNRLNFMLRGGLGSREPQGFQSKAA